MRKIRNLLVFAFFIFCLFLLKPREDVVFAAINESQCIKLFEKGKDFELCIEECLIYRGTYSISEDTIFLFYQDEIDLSLNPRDPGMAEWKEILPYKLLINKKSSRITDANGNSFSAQVFVDLRNKSPRHDPEKIELFKNQQPVISAIRSHP